MNIHEHACAIFLTKSDCDIRPSRIINLCTLDAIEHAEEEKCFTMATVRENDGNGSLRRNSI